MGKLSDRNIKQRLVKLSQQHTHSGCGGPPARARSAATPAHNAAAAAAAATRARATPRRSPRRPLEPRAARLAARRR